MRSVRARLTAWNGGVFAALMLTLGAGAYALLVHATLEQTDQALQQQLRAALLTIEASLARSGGAVGDDDVVHFVTRDLQQRGFGVGLDAREGVLLTQPLRAERLEASQRAADADDMARDIAISPDVLRAIRIHSAAVGTKRRDRRFTVPSDDGGVRIELDTVSLRSRPFIVAATEPLDEVDELLAEVRGTLLVAIPLLVALSVVVGNLLARSALAPVAAMTEQARRIGARTLHERLAVPNPHDELGQLAGTFNAVLDRVDRVLEQQHHFTADASHELRTPVAIIRSEADVALDAPLRSPEEYRDALRIIRDGSEQLSRIVNDMFLLARADAGQATMAHAPLYLDELAADAVRSMSSLAASRGVEFAVHTPDDVAYEGDESLLRRVLVNLLDNAVKHAPRDSTVTVTLATGPDGHRLTVTDAGPGIQEASRPFVFDRFYRADAARAREDRQGGTGAGLGLSIAREIAELHGGRLVLVEHALPTGTTFELFLPLNPLLPR